MKIHACLTAAILAIPVIVTAQAPRYTPEFLGSFSAGRMNEGAEMISRVTVGGNQRGIVVRAREPYVLLPLPPGMLSSWANDISDQGVVVGQVGPYYSPEFSGRAAAWYPDGLGGYTVQLLGALPGQTIGSATAVNNLGDIVGYSSNGTYRYPVYFRAPGDVVDLTSTGIFDPVDINDQRVLVDQSFTVKRLDLDTMIAQDLGVPAPSGGPRYLATRSSAINESNQVVGAAILTTSTSCDRQAARYTDGIGWEIFSSCGPNNGASDVNDRGDLVMCITISPYVHFEGEGTFALESLIVNDIGHWYAVTTSAGWINNSRQIVMYGTNPTTGQTGALLLTPEAATTVSAGADAADPAARMALSADPNPFRPGTTIRFQLPSSGPVDLAVYDVAGRRVRVLLAGRRQDAGFHAIEWDGRDESGRSVASGVYYCHLESGGQLRSNRLVLAR